MERSVEKQRDVYTCFIDYSKAFDTVKYESLVAPNDTAYKRGGAVTADSSCCINCVEPPRPQQWGPDLPFLGMPVIRTRWMAGAVAHKCG